MLEDLMSVWPKPLPASPSPLEGREGALVSVSIDVDPRRLESLLEALAQVSFPINPQIYHDAEVVYRYADGREESETATLVDFPAYAAQLEEVQRVLEAYGFDPQTANVTDMLEAIHGKRHASRFRAKQRVTSAAY
jgi:hypothetical protein